jgi:hypothetical protein
MADETIDLQFIGKQLEKLFTEVRDIRGSLERMERAQERMERVQEQMTRTQSEHARSLHDQGQTLVKLIDAVTEIAKVQDQHGLILLEHSGKLTLLTQGQKITEMELATIRARLERIEEHAGLVSA